MYRLDYYKTKIVGKVVAKRLREQYPTANQPVVGWLERMRCPQPIRVQFQDDMPVQSFGSAHKDRVCMCAFIEVSVCASACI